MKFDDVIRDFKGPKVWNFNAFWSILIIIERKTYSLLATRSNLVIIIIIIIIIILRYFFFPEVFSEPVHGIDMKPF